MKDLICITDEKDWRYGFNTAIKKVLLSTEANIYNVNPYEQDYKILASSIVDFIVISATIPIKSVEEAFKLISKNENANAHIFLISSEFEQFANILKVGTFPHIHFLSSPVDFEELSYLINSIFHPIHQGEGTKISLDFLKTFVDSTKYVLKDFCKLSNSNHQKPILVNKSNRKMYDLEGSIHLKSHEFEGHFYLGFSEPIYLKILEKVLGRSYTEIDEDNIDFSAEIVNMIYGKAKVHLFESGYRFQKALPEFKRSPPKHITPNPVFLVPIDTEFGTIDMKIEIFNK